MYVLDCKYLYIVGMHNIIGTLSVSASIGFKIKYRKSASTSISTNLLLDCCFLNFNAQVDAKFALVVGYVLII